jgi:hypothetical protein
MVETESGAPELLVDNQSTIVVSKNPIFHERSKHIDIRYHFICDCVDEDNININYTVMENQLADILTKAQGRIRFLELQSRVGVKAVDDHGQD